MLLLISTYPFKTIQCDNGKEFDNQRNRDFFLTHGILLRFSCFYTSQQNNKAERALRTLNDILRTLLLQAHMPPLYWAKALHTATSLLNIWPTKSFQLRTPHESLFHSSPTYTHLRVFGCLCFPILTASTTHKLAPRSIPCVFLGYPQEHKGYRCLDITSKRVIISRHVVFDENTFPFAALASIPPTSAEPSSQHINADILPLYSRSSMSGTMSNGPMPVGTPGTAVHGPSTTIPFGPSHLSPLHLSRTPPLLLLNSRAMQSLCRVQQMRTECKPEPCLALVSLLNVSTSWPLLLFLLCHHLLIMLFWIRIGPKPCVKNMMHRSKTKLGNLSLDHLMLIPSLENGLFVTNFIPTALLPVTKRYGLSVATPCNPASISMRLLVSLSSPPLSVLFLVLPFHPLGRFINST